MDDKTIDLKDIVRVIKKRWRIIGATFLVVVILVAVITFLTPPTYQAETTLRIKQPKSLASSLLSDATFGNSNATKEQMSTYAEILKSRTVVEKVIDTTQADKEKPPSYGGMLGRITTQAVKDTEILSVRVKASSPEEAQFVANTLVNTFLARMQELVRTEQGAVRQFIGERLAEAKKDLEKNEAALEDFKRDQKIVVPEEEAKAMVARHAAVDQMAADNAVAIAASQARLGSIDHELNGQSPGVIADSPLIQQYKSKLAELEVNLVTLRQNFTDKHPQVTATKAAIEETKASLSAEISRVLNAEAPSANPVYQGLIQAKVQNQAELSAAAAQLGAINQVKAASDQEMGQLPSKEQVLVKLTREADVSKQIYLMLAQRYEEARISEIMEPTDVQVIDTAVPDYRPISPRIVLNILIGIILGLFFGTALAFVYEYMNRTVRTPEDVKQYLDLPVLGSIPSYKHSEKLMNQSSLWSKLKVRLGI